jgi:hypothetical protein
MVGNESKYVEGGLSKIVDLVRAVALASLEDYQIDLL